jgi:serine/threonine-protein kinase
MTRAISPSEIEQLFFAALEHDPASRGAFLDRACASPELRRELESLLAADAQATGFLEPPAGPQRRIGPYRLVRVLGEGGTSTVYLAVRADEQYRQRVAIKLVRPEMDSRPILQRFCQERQILASLNHPNIARLLDGGSTVCGHPYFVMEYVAGEPLDVYCRERKLPLETRVELFRTVCQAVHYAHQNLIVHRDLKPSNILVDGEGVPKLLDFGIAKLLNPELAGIAVEPTAAACRLMTPCYASPEQVQGRPVSTASDVYSLGVLLYKLLTGSPPYQLDGQTLAEIERIVAGSTPAPPSQLMRAQRRERLPRDLDNIVLMAMRKEPERRYSSAQELADDLKRWLERRPVIARPDTIGYRCSSFVRRNAGAVAAALGVLASLVAGAVATGWQWRAAVVERGRAQVEKERAEQALGFIVELFKSDHSLPARGPVTADELLERGVARVRSEWSHEPGAQATFEHTLGLVYRNLGAYDRAAALLQAAVDARARAAKPTLELADSLYQLGAVRWDLGQPRVAEPLLERALEIRRDQLGPDHLLVAEVLEELANLRAALDRAEAEGDYRRALAIRRHQLGDSDPRVASIMVGLGGLYRVGGRYDEAEPLLEQALAIRRRALGDQHPDLVDSWNMLGLLRLNQGYFDEAEQYTNAAIEASARALGAEHPVTVDLTSIRVPIWREKGRYAEAEELARQLLGKRRALRGEGHPAVDNALYHLAAVLLERGLVDEAGPASASALAMRKQAYGPFHDSVAFSLAQLGNVRLAEGEPALAASLFQEALGVWKQVMGAEHPVTANAMIGLAESLAAEGRRDEARDWARRALTLQRRRLRRGHPAIGGSLAVLGGIVLAESPAEAEPLLREALTIDQAAFPPRHPHIARDESLLGACLARQGRADGGPLLRRGYESLRAGLGDAHAETRRAWRRLQEVEQRHASR